MAVDAAAESGLTSTDLEALQVSLAEAVPHLAFPFDSVRQVRTKVREQNKKDAAIRVGMDLTLHERDQLINIPGFVGYGEFPRAPQDDNVPSGAKGHKPKEGKNGKKEDSTTKAANQMIFVYMPEKSRDMLRAHAGMVAVDATFDCQRGWQFHVVWCLNPLTPQVPVPAVISLMNSQSMRAYKFVFTMMRDTMGPLPIRCFTADFELAQKQAFREIWPLAEYQGCAFHFLQCHRRRLTSVPEYVRDAVMCQLSFMVFAADVALFEKARYKFELLIGMQMDESTKRKYVGVRVPDIDRKHIDGLQDYREYYSSCWVIGGKHVVAPPKDWAMAYREEQAPDGRWKTTNNLAEMGNNIIQQWNKLLGPKPTNAKVIAHTVKLANIKAGVIDLATSLDHTGERARLQLEPARTSSDSAEARLKARKENGEPPQKKQKSTTVDHLAVIDAHMRERYNMFRVDFGGNGECIFRAFIGTLSAGGAVAVTDDTVRELAARVATWLEQHFEWWEELATTNTGELSVRQAQTRYVSALRRMARGDYHAAWTNMLNNDLDFDAVLLALVQLGQGRFEITVHSIYEATGQAAAQGFQYFGGSADEDDEEDELGFLTPHINNGHVRLVQAGGGRSMHFHGTRLVTQAAVVQAVAAPVLVAQAPATATAIVTATGTNYPTATATATATGLVTAAPATTVNAAQRAWVGAAEQRAAAQRAQAPSVAPTTAPPATAQRAQPQSVPPTTVPPAAALPQHLIDPTDDLAQLPVTFPFNIHRDENLRRLFGWCGTP
jgi:hypothetical protein